MSFVFFVRNICFNQSSACSTFYLLVWSCFPDPSTCCVSRWIKSTASKTSMLEPSVTLSKVHQPVQKNNAQLHSEKKERIRSSWIGLDRTGFARGCIGLVLMQVLNGFWMILVLVSVEMFDFRAAAEFGCYINIYQSRGHENAEYTSPPKSARCSFWIYWIDIMISRFINSESKQRKLKGFPWSLWSNSLLLLTQHIFNKGNHFKTPCGFGTKDCAEDLSG